MGMWSFLTGAPAAAYSSQPALLASPGSGDNLAKAVAAEFFGQLPTDLITVEIARRVPEVKKALNAHKSMVAPLRFEKFAGGVRVDDQPFWVSQTAYAKTSRLISMKLLTEYLFWHGEAVLGAWLDTEGKVYDWVPLPPHLWRFNTETGQHVIDERVDARYRMRAIYVPLGEAGVMADAVDSIRQARKLELARQTRLDAPPAATELHITDPSRDEMTREEKREVSESYVEGRQKHSVSVTPSYIEVKERGTSGQLDLFESAKNSLRLELAMHVGVPASFVEGGREGGTGGHMTYQNENGQPSEVWAYGSSRFAYAIAAALSGDDVVGPNAEVRFSAEAHSVPAPLFYDPEAGDAEASSTGLGTSTTEEK